MKEYTKNIETIFTKATQDLALDRDGVIKHLEWCFDNDKNVYSFMTRVLDWYNNEKHQMLWEMFHNAFSVDNLRIFFDTFDSFVANCLLDDSYFWILWRKPLVLYTEKSYKLDSGKEFKFNEPELQWETNGDIKYIETTKEDKESKPFVIWSLSDDKCSQNPKLLMEAMDIMEQRTNDRAKHYKELMEKFKNRDGE